MDEVLNKATLAGESQFLIGTVLPAYAGNSSPVLELQSQFLIGTVLHLCYHILNQTIGMLSQFLIGTVLHIVKRRKIINLMQKVSIPHRYGIT